MVAATVVTTALFIALHDGVCKIEGSIIVLFDNVILIVLFYVLNISRVQSDKFRRNLTISKNYILECGCKHSERKCKAALLYIFSGSRIK